MSYFYAKAREVTIVVLIILAGITLNAVIGEDGIIFQAKDTKNLISNETAYDNQQLAQLQNELKDNQLYSGIGIIPGTDTGGSSEGGEQGNGTHGGGTNQGGTGTNTGTSDNTQTGTPVDPGKKNNTTGGEISGETAQDPTIRVLEGEEIAASFYRSDITVQIFTQDKTQRIKYILTTTVPEINNELYPSGLVKELDIENGGTLTLTKDGEYTLTAYAYDTAGNKSNATVMWLKRETGTTPGNGVTVSVSSGNMGMNNWYTSNVTIRVLGTDTGSTRVTYRVVGTAYSKGIIGNLEFERGALDTREVEIANGTTFKIELDGEFAIVAYTYDSGGMRLSTATTLNVKRDATRPIVTLYKGEQVLGQGFQITLNAEDHASDLADGVEGENKAGKRYTYRHKLAPDMTYTDTTSQNNTQLYKTLSIDKTYDMYVIVTDNAGNKTASDVISKPALWVSKNEGSIGEKGTENARTYYQGNIDVSLTGQDRNNVDIKKVTYTIVGTTTGDGTMDGVSYNKGQALPETEQEITHNVTKTIPIRIDGNWTITVRNYNKENVVVSTNTLQVTRDTVDPVVTPIQVIGTEGETGYYREGITIKFRGLEETSTKEAYYRITGTATTAGKIGNTNVSTGTYDSGKIALNGDVNFDITADGTWKVEAYVSDRSGRPTVTRTVNFVRDTVAPTVRSYSGVSGTAVTFGSTTTVTITNDDFGVSGQATGGGYYYYKGSTLVKQKTANTFNYVTEGLGVDKVVTKDKAGNESTLAIPKITTINFPYTGSAQSLTLASGKYKLEVWGAQGGDAGGAGGKGAYAYKNLILEQSKGMNFIVGGRGGSGGGGGGGTFAYADFNTLYCVGGGGGGGGTTYYPNGGCGSGTNSSTGGQSGGTVASGGNGGAAGTEGGGGAGWLGNGADSAYGKGGKSPRNGGTGGVAVSNGNVAGAGGFGGGGGAYYDSQCRGGGGGGYSGGCGGRWTAGTGAGGGGSFGDVMIAGTASMPAPGGGTETGHSGNGYARITLVE